MLDELYIYCDETVYRDNILGIGLLQTQNAISESLIATALENLRRDKDSEKNRQDQETLRKGFFHAVDDSLNAHSHLVDQIRGHVNGKFNFSHDNVKERDTEELGFRWHTLLAIMDTLRLSHKIHIYFEQRNSFSQSACEELIESLYGYLDRMAYDEPHIPTNYPDVIVAAPQKKQCPGIQVVDFLIWATNCKLYEPGTKKAEWFDRAGARGHAFTKISGPGISISNKSGFAFFGQGIEDNIQATLSVYPRGLDLNISNNRELAAIYMQGEEILRRYATAELPSHAQHLQAPLLTCIRGLEFSGVHEPAKVQSVARNYVRLFDTLPIYQGLQKDSADFARLLKIKRHMGLVLNPERINGARTLDYFCQLRTSRR